MTQFTKALFGALLAAPLILGTALAQAQTNGGFETGLTGWTAAGDVSAQASVGGQTASGSFMAVLTNAAPSGLDDATALNLSGTAPIDFSFEPNFLGLPVTAFDLSPAVVAFEGSSLQQSFAVQAGDRLSFRWNLITNDLLDTATGIGGVDAAFFVVAQAGQPDLVVRLGESFEATTAASGGYSYATGNSIHSHTFSQSGLATIGFGVVDVGDYSVSSALALDQVILTPVPEAPLWALMAAGLALVGIRKSQNH
jgi:hypothetical protein